MSETQVSQSQAATSNPIDATAMAARKALAVQAFTVKVHLLKLESSLKARVTLAATGAPVASLKINFRSGSAAIDACAAFTDPEGIAECPQGTQVSPAFITDLLLAGYDAVFDGNAEFQPAKGHGSVALP
jgi:hypothetical protein